MELDKKFDFGEQDEIAAANKKIRETLANPDLLDKALQRGAGLLISETEKAETA